VLVREASHRILDADVLILGHALQHPDSREIWLQPREVIGDSHVHWNVEEKPQPLPIRLGEQFPVGDDFVDDNVDQLREVRSPVLVETVSGVRLPA